MRVHYTGKLTDGTLFDTSEGRQPLEFVVGDGSMIPGFDKAVLGMMVGQTKSADVPHADAYGPTDPNMVIRFGKDQIPEEIPTSVGVEIMLSDPNGYDFPAVIVEEGDDYIVLDANHVLAGKDLVFDITLVEIL